MTETNEHVPAWAKQLSEALNNIDERLEEIKAMDTAASIEAEAAKVPKPATAAEVDAVLNKIMRS